MPKDKEAKKVKRMIVEEVPPVKIEPETPKEEETPSIITAVEPEEKEEETVSAPPKEEIIETPKATEEPKEITIDEPEKAKMSPVFWILVPGVFLLGAILGGIIFYQKGLNTAKPEEVPVPTASASPSASPSAAVDLTKYTIAIFNGSGIAGEAGKAKTLLTDAGFKVGTTANAANYNYTKTIIKAKSTVDPAFVSALSQALGKIYLVDTAQTLATTSSDTVQVVIGSSKAQ